MVVLFLVWWYFFGYGCAFFGMVVLYFGMVVFFFGKVVLTEILPILPALGLTLSRSELLLSALGLMLSRSKY